MDRVIFLVDMQTFYASCEKADYPELKNKPVIVAGDPEKRSGIVLAACPIAKDHGVKTAEGLWQALKKCPQAVVRRPRMQHYIDVSVQITKIFQSFTDLVEPFSIDEQFMDVTGSLHSYKSPFEMALKVQKVISDQVGVYARIGIGPNKVLAKIACDNFGKKNNSGIFELNFNNIEEKLWPLPIGKMFGVGHRMEQHFLGMGIRTIGHLANFPIKALQKRWGINGTLLWQTAHGMDCSPVSPHTHDGQKAIGHHLTLPYDYEKEEDIRVILLELSEEVARRTRVKHYRGNVVSAGVRGANFDYPTGFYRQMKLPYSTNYGLDIYHAVLDLFNKHWDRQPVRSVGITLADLQPDNEFQLDLFGRLTEKEKLSQAMDSIYNKYGRLAIFRGPSLLPSSQLKERSRKIGGHYK
ncbi:DNA polymerase IV [Sporolactobacillus sp. KGMB 08714]|uniref:DNA polymerase IV n=1 Tax=Sporolactobacillus sp. KGMB 08714 TaxID=3064704 RepID=UPI002FBECDBD